MYGRRIVSTSVSREKITNSKRGKHKSGYKSPELAKKLYTKAATSH